MTEPQRPKNVILYADDDVDDLMLVRESFQQYSNNVEVVTFTDGVQALSYLQQLSPLEPAPCLIILDINMPRMNGKEVLVKLRQIDRYRDIPVIMFTTSSQVLDIQFATQYKAGFLTKPIELRQMEIITDQFIDHCSEDIKKNIRKQLK